MLSTSRKSLLGRAGIAIAVLLVLGMATEAFAARKAHATGFYRAGRGQVNLPMQFVLSNTATMLGHHSIPIGFPNDDGMIDDDISLIGKSPAAIVLPQFALSGSYSALLPLMGTTNVQITSMFTMFQGPANPAGALFSTMGGPGSFTFCPGASPGVPAGTCPAPPAAPQGSGTRNGRVVYTGGGGFGGVSQMILGGGGLVTRPRTGFGFGSPIFQAAQENFGGYGMGTMYQAPGGPYVSGMAYVNPNMLDGAKYTQPRTAPTTMGIIANAGPFVTSMGALTSCPSTSMGGAYPNIPLTGSLACVTATSMAALLQGPMGTTTNTGFPFTTGTVLAQQTTNMGAGPDFFTVTGSDARTPRGIGNITMAAGGLALRTTNISQVTGGSMDTISLTISEKAPSMSAAGFAATALLMVLAAGYAMRRRF